ncbi:hypothetical protein [Streptomyces sp. NPDC054838]
MSPAASRITSRTDTTSLSPVWIVCGPGLSARVSPFVRTVPFAGRHHQVEFAGVLLELLVVGYGCSRAPAAAPGHPWTGAKFSATWGSRDVLDTTLVRPALVAEVSADRAIDRGGVFRHPLRFQRLRLDVTTEDVPRFGAGPSAAAG